MERENSGSRIWGYIVIFALALISLPFWVGAGVSVYDALTAPESQSFIFKAPLFTSAVFYLGFAAGLVSSGIALGSSRPRHKEYGIAGVMLGFSFLLLAYMMNWSLNNPAAGSSAILPFLLPSILAFVSLMLLVNSFRAEDKPQEAPSEEPQQPQSQP